MTEGFPCDNGIGHSDGQGEMPIVFFGAGSQSLVLHELLDSTRYKLCAIFSDYPDDRTDLAPLIIGTEAIKAWVAGQPNVRCGFAVAMGGGLGVARCEKIALLKELGLTPITLVHHTAYVSLGVRAGDACQILAKSFCGVNTRLGAGSILNSSASVDHECILEEGVHVAPGSVILGRVRIGRNTFVGANSTILSDLTIAADVVLGAGSLVTRDILESGTYIGAPARKVAR